MIVIQYKALFLSSTAICPTFFYLEFLKGDQCSLLFNTKIHLITHSSEQGLYTFISYYLLMTFYLMKKSGVHTDFRTAWETPPCICKPFKEPGNRFLGIDSWSQTVLRTKMYMVPAVFGNRYVENRAA